VVSAVALEAANNSLVCIGFMDGFSGLKKGAAKVVSLDEKTVSSLQQKAGSVLRASKEQLDTESDLQNTIRCLLYHRVRYLVVIGGFKTVRSTALLQKEIDDRELLISIVQVPKTIFQDLPMRCFGYSSARQAGASLVTKFHIDARTSQRWFILVCIGQTSGHLALGISKATSTTISLIPEHFADRKEPPSLAEVCDILEGSIVKRAVLSGKRYGVAIVSEGIINKMDPAVVKKLFGGTDDGHQQLGAAIAAELKQRFAKRNAKLDVVSRNIGYEFRSVEANAEDVSLTRDCTLNF
jgi:6-phosphofructokinase 1